MLDSGDPTIAAIAHGEVARAPYRAIRDLGAGFDGADLLARIAAETDPSRRAGYILLLGAAGGPGAAQWVDRRLQALLGPGAAATGDRADLAALLAAAMELHGPGFAARIGREILFAPASDPAWIDAALLALSVQGGADRRVPRGAVVAVYREFLRRRPAMAGFVLADLTAWADWSLTEEVAAALDRGAITDPAGAFAAAGYVDRGPAARRLESEVKTDG